MREDFQIEETKLLMTMNHRRVQVQRQLLELDYMVEILTVNKKTYNLYFLNKIEVNLPPLQHLCRNLNVKYPNKMIRNHLNNQTLNALDMKMVACQMQTPSSSSTR